MTNKTKSINIREATTEDLSNILQLNHHLHKGEQLLEATPSVKEIWNQIINDTRLHCFIADYKGASISSCMLDIIPNLTRGSRPFGVLQNVVTHKDYRGLGIGTMLNKYALDFAWSKECYQVLVQTGRPEVVAFYERLGFRRDKIGLVAKPQWLEFIDEKRPKRLLRDFSSRPEQACPELIEEPFDKLRANTARKRLADAEYR